MGNYFTEDEQLISLLECARTPETTYYIEGKPVVYREILRTVLREDCAYMTDFFVGERGVVEEIHFHKVT